ncbi:MAG TPA: hypothetical protein VG452_11210, partial [Egibacteraceae bacterium]|nr:hypothetical protein [Egibacteraceae bacterium]
TPPGGAGAPAGSQQPPDAQLDELLGWDAVDAASALDLAAEDLPAEEPPPARDVAAVPAEPDDPRQQHRTRQRAVGLLAGLLALGLAVVGALQLAL